MGRFTLVLLAGLITIGCSGGPMKTTPTTLPSLKEVPESSWQKLAEKKIYFGHQSVGFNVVDGIKDVLRENPKIRLNLQETDDPTLFSAPLLAHSQVGRNTNPGSKIQAFAGLMDNGLGNKADIAFFKFCYVDVTSPTDVEKVFAEYKTTLTALQNKYPRTTFLHLTVPLTTVPPAFKPRIKWVIKKIIGRATGPEDNIQREVFNQLLRANFGRPLQTKETPPTTNHQPSGTDPRLPPPAFSTWLPWRPPYPMGPGWLSKKTEKPIIPWSLNIPKTEAI